MRLFYGPADLLHAASSVKDGVTGAVTDVGDLFDLLGRGVELMERAEALVTGAEGLLLEAQTQLDRSARTLDDAQALTSDARALTAQAEAELAALTPLREVAQEATPMLATATKVARDSVVTDDAVNPASRRSRCAFITGPFAWGVTSAFPPQ